MWYCSDFWGQMNKLFSNFVFQMGNCIVILWMFVDKGFDKSDEDEVKRCCLMFRAEGRT